MVAAHLTDHGQIVKPKYLASVLSYLRAPELRAADTMDLPCRTTTHRQIETATRLLVIEGC
jgi:hypothetical protein